MAALTQAGKCPPLAVTNCWLTVQYIPRYFVDLTLAVALLENIISIITSSPNEHT